MKRAGLLLLLLATPATLLPINSVCGQGITILRPSGELGLAFDGLWSTNPTKVGGYRTFREWFRLDLAGSVYDPRLVNFSFDLRPYRAQRLYRGEPASPNGGEAGLGFRARINALSAAPVSLSLAAFRSSDNNRGRFGSEIDYTSAGWGALISYRNPYLPLQLEFADRSRELIRRPRPGQLFSEDDVVRTWRLSARNRKTRIRLEHYTRDDQIFDRDFATNRADLGHLFRWGKGSRITSNFNYLDRTGYAPYNRLSWQQAVHLQHTWDVSSDIGYRLLSLRTPGGRNESWAWNVDETYRARHNLDLRAEFFGSRQRFDFGRESYYRVRPGLAYSESLPWQLHFSGALSFAYEWHDRETSAAGTVPVADERHVIDVSGRFTLNEWYVDESTVLVTSVDQVTLYEEGLDYRVVASEPITEILTLPGGRLALGDTVSVDYRYQVLPDAQANATVLDYNLRLQRGALSVYHRRSVQDPLDGAELESILLVRGFDIMAAGIGYSPRLGRGSLSLLAEYRRNQARTYDFSNYALRAMVNLMLRPDVRWLFGGRTDFRRGGSTDFDLYEAESSVYWQLMPRLQAMAGLALWHWTQDGRRERFMGGSLGADWRAGMLIMRLRYDGGRWRDGYDRTESRLYLVAAREF